MKGNNMRKKLSIGIIAILILTIVLGFTFKTDGSGWSEQVIMSDTEVETNVYHFDTGLPGKTIVVVGGIHGDETAGFKAAESLKNEAELLIEAGDIYFIPRANQLATELDLRYPKHLMDLNRAFDGEGESDLTLQLASEIKEMISSTNPDFVIDHHESRDSYKNGRLGNTLIVADYNDNLFEGLMMIDLINPKLDEDEAFILESNPPVGSINDTLSSENLLVVTIETNRKLLLEKRVEEQRIIAKTLIKYYSNSVNEQ